MANTTPFPMDRGAVVDLDLRVAAAWMVDNLDQLAAARKRVWSP